MTRSSTDNGRVGLRLIDSASSAEMVAVLHERSRRSGLEVNDDDVPVASWLQQTGAAEGDEVAVRRGGSFNTPFDPSVATRSVRLRASSGESVPKGFGPSRGH